MLTTKKHVLTMKYVLLRNSEAKFFDWPLSFGNLENCEYAAKERDSCLALYFTDGCLY